MMELIYSVLREGWQGARTGAGGKHHGGCNDDQ